MTDKKVLIVDDEIEVCELLQSHIEEMTEYKAIMVHNAKDALDKVREQKIDVIISDVRMPNGDGMELLENIKALPPPRPHVIIISCLYEDEQKGDVAEGLLKHITDEITQEEVQEKGAYSYLPKPLNYQDVITALNNILKK